MQKEHVDGEIVTYFKLYILLYADDTVILATYNYCSMKWKKIVIRLTLTKFIPRGKLRKHHIFIFGEHIFDTVNEYLGLVLNHNAKYKIAKSHLYQKGCRALLQKKQKCISQTEYTVKTFQCTC